MNRKFDDTIDVTLDAVFETMGLRMNGINSIATRLSG